MLRNIAGVVIGYMVMAIVMFATFTGAYLALGSDNTFVAGSYHVSMLWIAVSLLLGFIAAAAGGYACAAIARDAGAVRALAVLVFTLTLVAGMQTIFGNRPNEVRTGDVPNIEAMQKAENPAWFALLSPLVGALGVMVGARSRK